MNTVARRAPEVNHQLDHARFQRLKLRRRLRRRHPLPHLPPLARHRARWRHSRRIRKRRVNHKTNKRNASNNRRTAKYSQTSLFAFHICSLFTNKLINNLQAVVGPSLILFSNVHFFSASGARRMLAIKQSSLISPSTWSYMPTRRYLRIVRLRSVNTTPKSTGSRISAIGQAACGNLPGYSLLPK